MKKQKISKKKIILISAAVMILGIAVSWIIIRTGANAKCIKWTGQEAAYTEEEKILKAMSLSYFVYGCETCKPEDGTVSEILEKYNPGIVAVNDGIKRTDKSDPGTALIDTGEFICKNTGNFRLLFDKKDKSGFYAAAFADDENKAVWIAYSGSVSFKDAFYSVKLAVGAGLSKQEKCAFEFYENVMQTYELTNGYGMILTGHSLGGALASMVSYVSGCEAVTISGADGLAISKISKISDKKADSCKISNYLTSPENGYFTFLDIVQRMMFMGTDEGFDSHIYEDNGLVKNAHCVFGFITFEDDDISQPVIPDEK